MTCLYVQSLHPTVAAQGTVESRCTAVTKIVVPLQSIVFTVYLHKKRLFDTAWG